ncbi:DUF5723 family protein [Rudanella paleaurantiibacter]|nr:DUF5723 family protein [Rudanella paleaurantiibacter]
MKQSGLLLSGLLASLPAFAQPLIPLQTSNYAGTHGIYLNPSSMADSRLSFQLNLGFGAFDFTRQPLPVGVAPFGKALFSAGSPRGVNRAEVRGPAVMAQFGRKRHAVGLTTRYRSGYALGGNYELIRWINGTNPTAPAGLQSFNFAAEGYTEYAISYAVSLIDIETHHLKVGATAKVLRGLQRTDLSAQASFAGGTAGAPGYTAGAISGNTTDLASFDGASLGQKLAGPSAGRGTGYDVGVAYEFRPKQRFYRYEMDGKRRAAEEMTKYLFRIGFSVLDIGEIQYNRITTYATANRSGTFRRTDYEDKAPNQIESQLLSQFGPTTSLVTGEAVRRLPQTTSVQLDVYLGRSWFGNVVYQTAMPIQTNAGLYRGAVLAVGPRSEGPGGELAGTVYYYPDIQKVALGLHGKAGIFIFGSDNLLGIFGDNGLPPHVYAGLSLPFNARRPKDRDKDRVSDKLDRCPDVPGVLAFGGCPDTDLDGVADSDDTCPTVAGPVATNGCPDTDLDGVLDKDDRCPKVPGLARYNGCPDTDNDGVGDDRDECPTIVGRADMAGCPDTDNDGTPDQRDLCQSEVGLNELDGCLLKDRTLPVAGLSDTDALLLAQLRRAFVQGPRAVPTVASALVQHLRAQPSQKLSIELTGQKESALRQMENGFRDELTRLGVPTGQLIITTQVKEGLPAGFAVAWAL